MTAVGFVGLGTMGAPLAERLLDAGHELHGTNRTAAKAQPLIDRGLRWHATPRGVAAAADVVFSMVSDDDALEAIATGPEGVLAGLAPGKVWIDMSTVSPDAGAALAERVRSTGARMLDAPVSGRSRRSSGARSRSWWAVTRRRSGSSNRCSTSSARP